jgi:4-amino-4-deoxy-L-arabinose transferase-like glycosyltransferase
MADWFRPAPLASFAICALPWYILCAARNGTEFLNVFFVQQQFGRFSTAALQHVQPWWFYIPAALLLMFPWFPLLGLTGRSCWTDPKPRVLAYVAIFGLVFFSASVNKLPSYVLPLLPGVMVLIALGVARLESPGWWLMAPVALTGMLAMLPDVVAASLAHGLRSADIRWLAIGIAVSAAAVLGAIISLKASRDRAFLLAATVVAVGFLWFEARTFPSIDRAASARPRWLAYHPTCAPGEGRNLAYGLYYYSDSKLPDCNILDQNGTLGVR